MMRTRRRGICCFAAVLDAQSGPVPQDLGEGELKWAYPLCFMSLMNKAFRKNALTRLYAVFIIIGIFG